MSDNIIQLEAAKQALGEAYAIELAEGLTEQSLALAHEIMTLNADAAEGRFRFADCISAAAACDNLDALIIEVAPMVDEQAAEWWRAVIGSLIASRLALLPTVVQHYRRARNERQPRQIVAKLDVAMAGLTRDPRAAELIASVAVAPISA